MILTYEYTQLEVYKRIADVYKIRDIYDILFLERKTMGTKKTTLIENNPGDKKNLCFEYVTRIADVMVEWIFKHKNIIYKWNGKKVL